MRPLLLSSIACLALQGCSFLFMHGPPARHEKLEYFDCDSNAAGPVADGVWAAIDGLLLASFASLNDTPGERVGAGPVAVTAAVGVAHVASAIYGIATINRCSGAKEQLRQRIMASSIERQRILDELQHRLDAAVLDARRSPAASSAPNVPSRGEAPAAAAPATPTDPSSGAKGNAAEPTSPPP